ncbi:MAG: putative 4-deoxy-4-formamido-L-arabinose-phosphoundecaprenol deformylase ArnD [Dehalococcoidia bacterium]|nr:putative 4-deoxy-4-formamido-L-arabinose-phosphoundecaprenol deformylase ArnD [Bacillota bacterium]MBT9140756.1 putative 4-deoxy-4-formamido-L-arabinose-phosphoundecaprenol deformylase ArnD [Bacillota bacterium]MBT9142757.1 putative 4-deoxy-4-formamido-L-arabinose-phosphoundecaprenol deformylase ArnD [Bacillota bacterium]
MAKYTAIKVDVDTLTGLCVGVPNILDLLADYSVKATFFVPMGPDNSGKHIGRVIKKDFLSRMLKMNPVKMIGFKNLLYGTVLKPPLIGKGNAAILKRIVDEGHELGIHGWDHYQWQRKLERMSKDGIRRHLRLSAESYAEIFGSKPKSTAAPGWNTTNSSLEIQEEFGFLYSSDARGIQAFRPKINGKSLRTLQIPTTLPGMDELGVAGFSSEQILAFFEKEWQRNTLLVLGVHAEIEGITMRSQFQRLLALAATDGVCFERLDSIAVKLYQDTVCIPEFEIAKAKVKGLEGLFSCQKIS